MAQGGDTITYTFSGSKETEDISNIGKIVIDQMHGADGVKGEDYDTPGADGGSGGYIENATVDVSNFDVLEIWVGETDNEDNNGGWGRSNGGGVEGVYSDFGSGGGSTELVARNSQTDETMFIAAADAGGGGGASSDGDPLRPV